MDTLSGIDPKVLTSLIHFLSWSLISVLALVSICAGALFKFAIGKLNDLEKMIQNLDSRIEGSNINIEHRLTKLEAKIGRRRKTDPDTLDINDD
jgi:hypothetical protein